MYHSKTQKEIIMFKTLKWPVVCLLITGSVHFILEAVAPDMKDIFIPPVLAPLLLAYGIWTGYKTVAHGGNYVSAIVAGAILGLLPLMLDSLGFGMILGRGVQWGLLAGVFGFSMILFGSLIGSGFALSNRSSGV
jgi:hypothetical protein